MFKFKANKIFILILILALALVGCGDKASTTEESKEPIKEEKEENKQQEESDTIEITDMAGRKLTIPKNVKTIATPNVDAYRMLVQLGATDKLIGAPSNMYNSKYSKEDTIEVKAWPEVKNLEKVGGGSPGSEINTEALIVLKPDVIISWSYGKKGNSIEMAEKIQQQSGIPVVCLNSISKSSDAEKQFKEAYKLMGIITGKEDRAKELLAYYQEGVKDVQERIKGLEPKSVYMSNPRSILNKSTSYLPIKQLKLNDVTKGMDQKTREVSKEQLVKWNPDIIFMHTPSKVHRIKINEVIEDPILKNINAIKNKQYYHVKAYFMGWDISTGLVDLYYMGKIAYPEAFEDINVKEKGNEILKKFYGIDGLYENLEKNNNFYKFDN